VHVSTIVAGTRQLTFGKINRSRYYMNPLYNFLLPINFAKFVFMAIKPLTVLQIHVEKHLVLDMSDCYTWSFPEFVPFCPKLYYFSNFKDFNTLTQA